jgi:hypothetical protein
MLILTSESSATIFCVLKPETFYSTNVSNIQMSDLSMPRLEGHLVNNYNQQLLKLLSISVTPIVTLEEWN